MFVSEADRAPSSTAEQSRIVDRLFVWAQRRIERRHQLQSKAGMLTDCLSGMESTLSCLQANCYDDLAAVDRLLSGKKSTLSC